MNIVCIIGRITRDPEVKYSATGVAVARFSVAIDRGKDKNGEDRGADYPMVCCMGKTAEIIEKWAYKGQLVGVNGRVQTGSYDKNGQKVYYTEIVAERVEFLSRKQEQETIKT